MSVVDPRELGDRDLFVYLLLGDLPRAGWAGRRRAIAYRALQVAVMTALAILVLIAVLGLIVLIWAASL